MKRLLPLAILIFTFSCKVQQEAKKVTIQDNFIKNELLVQMNDLDEVDEMEAKFSKQGLRLLDEVSPRLRMVLLTFDTTKIEPRKMFAKLKLSDYCREIEFNKRLTQRGE